MRVTKCDNCKEQFEINDKIEMTILYGLVILVIILLGISLFKDQVAYVNTHNITEFVN
jgi:uncharacterized membrane protein affecting hemolysin expression